MALQSVADAEFIEEREQALNAFKGYDKGVYMDWLAAISDVLMTGGDAAAMAKSTLPNLGGVMYALTQAAEEMDERERSARLGPLPGVRP